MITRKTSLIVSTLFVATLLILVFFQKICVGRNDASCLAFINVVGDLGRSILISIPLFLFSLLAFKLRDEVFRSWVNFAIWWVPLSVLLPFLASDRGMTFFMSWREVLWLLLPSLFVIISLFIIVGKSLAVRKKPTKR